MTDNRVPEWVYRSELRAPETDDEPWAVELERRVERRRLSGVVLVLCVLVMVALVLLAGVRR